MRTIKITDEDFNRFIWPSVAMGSPENVDQLETIVGLVRKLKDMSEETDEVMMMNGQGIPARKLKTKTKELKLEKAEHKIVQAQVGNLSRVVRNAFVEEYNEVYQKIKSAEGAEK
jgi:hypothetical protein